MTPEEFWTMIGNLWWLIALIPVGFMVGALLGKIYVWFLWLYFRFRLWALVCAYNEEYEKQWKEMMKQKSLNR